jgi:sarcosine oxidase delta subunit
MTISMIEHTEPGDLVTHQSNFKQKLEDVIENLQITPDLTISYRDREPVTIESHLHGYLNQISLVDRNRYLATKLQKYLYSIFSSDSQPQNTKADQETTNYVNKWSRTKFYQHLLQRNQGKGYSDPNWLVVKQEANYWQVTKNDLTLHIQLEKHLAEPREELHPGELVAIKMPPNLVDRGFYIAVGDSGTVNVADSPEKGITQIYFNVNAAGALVLLDDLTRELNAREISFDFKVAYDEAQFDNLDSAVLNFQSRDFELLYPVVNNAYQKNQSYFQSKVPFFCQPLAPGLGLAEKPRSPTYQQKNIGQYYCGMIATAIVEKWQEDGLTENKLADVLNYLSLAGLDINHLYLNPVSPRSYQAEIN